MDEFERNIKQKIKAYLHGLENPFIIEIGSNDCTDTLQFYDIFFLPTVIGFEPDKAVAERGWDNIMQKQRDWNYVPHLFNFAVTNVDGKKPFYRSSNNGLSSSLHTPKWHTSYYPTVEFDNGENMVDCIKLDTFVKDLGYQSRIIDLCWLDCQGAELEVIEGGKTFFQNCKFLYTEFSQIELYEGAPDVSQILHALGENWEIAEYMWVNGHIDGNVLLRNTNFLD